MHGLCVQPARCADTACVHWRPRNAGAIVTELLGSALNPLRRFTQPCAPAHRPRRLMDRPQLVHIGHHVIPNALAQEMKVYAFQHDGYWHVS